MKFVIAVTCGVLCSAAALFAQVGPSISPAGARSTLPGPAAPGSPNLGASTASAAAATVGTEPAPAVNSGTPGAPVLPTVQALYASAAYEDALAAMPAPGQGASRDIEQYRALCLLALGRQTDAAASVDRIVSQDPLFSPSGSDTPPRLQAMYTESRGRLAPGLAKSAYADAKAAYEKKDRAAAHEAFQRTLDVIALVPDPADAGLSDLRELASGFLQLTAAGAGAAAPAAAPATPASLRALAAGGPNAAGPSNAAADGRGSAGADAPGAGPAAETAAGVDGFRGPVAIRQDMPGWQPPDTISRRTEYRGLIHVAIDSAGRVEELKVVKPSHPAYDAAIARAARQWQFSPATRDGRPVASEKDIEVYLRPQ